MKLADPPKHINYQITSEEAVCYDQKSESVAEQMSPLLQRLSCCILQQTVSVEGILMLCIMHISNKINLKLLNHGQTLIFLNQMLLVLFLGVCAFASWFCLI